MRKFLSILLIFCSLSAFAQADRHDTTPQIANLRGPRHDVRAGNRKFGRERYKESEIDYRKAVLKDSTSVTAQYDLASSLYRQEDWAGSAKALESVKEQPGLPAQYHYNAGDVALQQKDWQAAVDAFRASLLLNPGDLDAKENYIYAKKMLENQQGGGQGDNDQQQDQNDQQNQDQQDRQNQDQQQNQQNQDQNQDNQQQDRQPQEQKISPQQARQMLNAIQAKEKETQDKVEKAKALKAGSRQKEKNW